MNDTHLLLVEDNEGDILLTTEALEEKNIISRISVVKNGQEAIDFVFRQGNYINAAIPDLILLDINLPKKNGHEVLHAIKSDTRTKNIPVIMLTTSSSERDINLAYQNHVNCFITKPVDVIEFIEAINSIEKFWIHLAKLPKLKQ